jgi:hypothetical protein
MRTLRLGLTIGMLGALLLAPAAYAAQSHVVIVIDIAFDDPNTQVIEPNTEAFTAFGDINCSGVAITDPFHFAGGGRQGRGAGTFHLVKTLTCVGGPNDGESFQILVQAVTTPTGTIGGWTVVGASDAFDGLRGAGSIVGTGLSDHELQDVYTGFLTT